MPRRYKLYGAELSLYTGKVRAYLRFKQIPFIEIFSSRRIYQDVIEPKTGVRFIPVIETPEGEFIQDTAGNDSKSHEVFECCSWAQDKVDWYDPNVAKPDSLLKPFGEFHQTLLERKSVIDRYNIDKL